MASSLNGQLYIVATPIGNFKDITLRALETLKSVDFIAAEDTRNTSNLLNHYEINKKLISCHKFSESSRIELFSNYLKDGLSIALVSDAGTPLISDPGNVVVKALIEQGFKVVPVVGASAVIALLSATYRKDEDFKFIGFLPRVKNQIKETIIHNNYENLVFYESPNRILETLEIIKETYPDKKVTLGRELTKKFEEIISLNVQDLIEYYNKNTLKGEIVVLLHKSEKVEEFDFDEKIKKLKALKLKDKEISSILSELYNCNKNMIYKRCLAL